MKVEKSIDISSTPEKVWPFLLECLSALLVRCLGFWAKEPLIGWSKEC